MNETKIPKVLALEKLLQYNVNVQTYSFPVQVPVGQFTNGFVIRNIGTSVLICMGDPLAAGESKTIGGNRGEIYVGRLDIKFTGAGINSALVTEKFYMNIPISNESL